MSEIDNRSSQQQFICFDISSLAQLDSVTQKISACLKPGIVFYLHGELGAGKTTFTQHLYRHAGGMDTLTSPTFSLMETYTLDKFTFIHLDLYRLNNDSELDMLALRDYFDLQPVWCIEWPRRVGSGLPPANANLYLQYNAHTGRRQLRIEKNECVNIGLNIPC